MTPKGEITTRRARVTINDLAAELGLAKGTVSRALNGYPDIAEATRLRVARAAERMGYRPLAQAQAIRTGRARSLGLVLNAGRADAHKPFLTDFLDGISRGASEENWTLTVATALDEEDEVATLDRLVDEHKVDGFILPRTKRHDPRIALLRRRAMPFVLYGRTGEPEGCAWFDISGEDAMAGAVARLARRGHRRIGFLGGHPDFNFTHLRRDGYLAGLTAAGLPHDPDLIQEGIFTVPEAEVAALRLLDLPDAPSAIVCALDLAAMGLYRAAPRAGRQIGRDLAVISYDGIPEAATLDPPLTTYVVDTRAAGRRLAQMLLARIRGTAPEALREIVPARLIPRGSDRIWSDARPDVTRPGPTGPDPTPQDAQETRALKPHPFA
ncbi:transcriptional regulator, LacI family [Roseibacterium elongatum DSM 19469]|uniref:Transcriptional regulator, LacI family n=1 Tax=Roseicyclus elongatus DSM 19469 TaxID=1294273 RepID=W8S1T0_9RHOB|nr:substrate-binding domain-containing protein [Roseibacterium elongatum]AHM02691.1 transcriptional regulator, LacI family [Roseibacterium elongatum DSM 19469]